MIYTRCCVFVLYFSVLLIALAKAYSFAIFGVALAVANCKCVWLLALANSSRKISSIPLMNFSSLLFLYLVYKSKIPSACRDSFGEFL